MILEGVLPGHPGHRGRLAMSAAAMEADLDDAIVNMELLVFLASANHTSFLTAQLSILATHLGTLGLNVRHLVTTVQRVEIEDESAAAILTPILLAAL